MHHGDLLAGPGEALGHRTRPRLLAPKQRRARHPRPRKGCAHRSEMTLTGGPASSLSRRCRGASRAWARTSRRSKAAASSCCPCPYDSTTSYRGGTRDGPRAIIDASRYLEDYDMETEREVYRVGIHTLPEIEPHVGGPEAMTERIASAVRPACRQGPAAGGPGRRALGLGGRREGAPRVPRRPFGALPRRPRRPP